MAKQRETGMLYQVLARANAQAAWEPYQAMTRDPLQALTLLRRASRTYAEVSVIEAESAVALRQQVRQLRAGEPTGQESCPVPSLSGTPRLSLVGATIESQRWAIEQGPGGDHDVPYRFEPTLSAHTLQRWAQLVLAARLLDDEAEEALDAAETLAISDLAELPESDAGDETLAVEPSVVRSNRII